MQLEIHGRSDSGRKLSHSQSIDLVCSHNSWYLNNSILLRITTERQAFQREQNASEKQEEAARRLKQSRGFEKQVAILEGIKPSTAINHLLGLESPDEAAELLLSMNDRKAKRIVDAAKSPDQQQRINKILRRMKEASEREASAP